MTLSPDAQPFSADGGPIGALVIHGFTGMPGSMRPWAEHLAAAGLSVRLPRLPGHGTRWQDANKVSWEDWSGEVDRAFDDLRSRCESVFVLGLSMGGTLALRVAEVRGDEVAGVVVVNPSLFTLRKDAKLLPVLRFVIPWFPPIASDIKKEGVTEPAYDKLPVKGAWQVNRLWAVTNAELGKITQPLLVFNSRVDHVNPTQCSGHLIDSVSSTDKRLVWLENSYHVATMDNDAPLIFEQSLAFVRAHAPSLSA